MKTLYLPVTVTTRGKRKHFRPTWPGSTPCRNVRYAIDFTTDPVTAACQVAVADADVTRVKHTLAAKKLPTRIKAQFAKMAAKAMKGIRR